MGLEGAVTGPRVPGARVLAGYVVLLSTLTSAAWLAGLLYALAKDHPARLPEAALGSAAILAPYPWLLWQGLLRRTRAWHRAVLGGMVAVGVVLAVGLGQSWVMALTAPAALFGAVWTSRAGLAVGLAGLIAAAMTGYGLAAGWPVLPTLFTGAYLIAAAFSGAMAVWFCHVVEELRVARAELAGQAVGQERQRFARDLHDVLGHSLQAVALRAELAEKMIDRDPARVAKELAEIQAVARGAVQDVREVVRGYRATSLRTELEGMRAVLTAAGISCETPDVPPDLPGHVHETLGWVAREAATNILRHSTATWCSLAVTAARGTVRLEIVNDGARGLLGGDQGSGLAGLAERVAAGGGTFAASPGESATFHVTATLPVAVRDREAGGAV